MIQLYYKVIYRLLEGGNKLADSIGTKEAAKRWGSSQNTISRWCREGLIENATQDGEGSPWHIPKNAECPKQIKKKQKKRL